GLYPDTMKPGETFITIAKEGSTISGLFDVIATLTSMCLQSGVPLKTLVRKFKDLRLSCDNGIRADKLDSDLLRIMKEAGFFRIAIGVEAGNNKVLRAIKKRQDIDTIRRLIQSAWELDFEVDLFFLVGCPYETWADLQDSFKIALSYPINTAFFYNPIPFPNTELFDWIEHNGRLLRQYQDYLNDFPILDNEPVFETPQMSLDQRRKALKIAFGVSRITMRRSWKKRLSRWGIFGRVIASIYTTRIMQDRILRIRFFNLLFYRLVSITSIFYRNG
ncbi:MAG: radical SAM protein, partial [Candidatus Omnitrophica bacterium]|nr:radical SAM protein [Candidatus Omnitrophota bacterium]